MVSWIEGIAALAGGSTLTVVAQSGAAWLKSRGERHKIDRDADIKIEEHRDKLTFDLLDAARLEAAAARQDAAELRPMLARLAHFEEALDHIHDLLHAEMPDEKKAAERRARAFLNRMRRIGDARGAILNEVQRAQSVVALIHPDGDLS